MFLKVRLIVTRSSSTYSVHILTSELKVDCAGQARGTVGVAVARSASIKGVGGFLGSDEGDGQLED